MSLFQLVTIVAAVAASPQVAQGAGSAPAQCSAQTVQKLAGQTVDTELREEARRRSGSRIVRVIRPVEAVSADYREDRLNLEVDRTGRLLRATCG